MLRVLRECEGFEWDEGNLYKSQIKHQVLPSECEQVFFNLPLVIQVDQKHSTQERRFYALGHTDTQRKLFVVFAIRKKHLRVISARDMSKREREAYDQAEKKTVKTP